MREPADARSDWQHRIGRRSVRSAETARPVPPAPAPGGLRAEEGAGHVTLRWDAVPGALGYLVSRSEHSSGPFEAVDHGGGDVLAVPGPPYTDTTVEPGRAAWYAVAALADLERGPGPRSDAVRAAARPGGQVPPVVTAHVRADRGAGALRRLWHMIGSERLSQLLDGDASGGRPIGAEFTEALAIARDELGARRIRAHAILHDDLGVYREAPDGTPEYDFDGVDRVYDRLLGLGLRPVVELSFMPRDLARDPDATVFGYRGIISPPRDWGRWADLVAALAAHLVDRHGIDEVAGWGFEVWNEANLEVFWTGTQDEYVRLYETAARAVKAVDGRLRVGGPATAAAGWIGDFLDAVTARDMPLDFVTTHTYGNVPLDVRALTRARGLTDVEVEWTEWGITPTHFAQVTDSAFGAPFVLHGMKRSQRTTDALAYWVVSDHFEELGRPPALLHGGFGLLTVGNLRKPRFWALALAEQLCDELCAVTLSGDGAGGLVDAWASASPDGRVDVLVWNGTIDQTKAAGAPLLDRTLRLRVDGLADAPYRVTIARVDDAHSSVTERWKGDRAWPDPDEWAALRAGDRLDCEDLGVRTPDAGTLALAAFLPMPGVVRVRLQPST